MSFLVVGSLPGKRSLSKLKSFLRMINSFEYAEKMGIKSSKAKRLLTNMLNHICISMFSYF
ncbi:hypothetical protein CCR75_002250 [Bremia lactucae]|uniref:Uncharacterized protein n=1 Tax=Bremia lactucae TaxID=4779 RepID=A0A976IF15_BRELC|nr:hypothetical protein CCR75_002250 [Bremia lactucae]